MLKSFSKENYENVVDYRLDLLLHKIRNEIKESFANDSYKQVKQQIVYDNKREFKSPESPSYFTNKPTIKANYVNAYDSNDYFEQFFHSN